MSSGYVSVPDANIFYTVQGPDTGIPMLLVHGWTCDQTDWSFQFSSLLSRSLRVIAVDLRAHGRSSITTITSSADMSIPTMANDCAAVLAHLGIKDGVIAMGHSMGAIVVDALTNAHPNLVKAKVLVDPSYYMPVAMMEQFIATVEKDGFMATLGPFFEGACTPTTPSWIKDWNTVRALGMDPEVAVLAFKQLRDYLGPSQVEYLCEKGKKVHGIRRLVFASLPGFFEVDKDAGIDSELDRIELIEESHFLMKQAPEKINAVLLSWLEECGVVNK